MNTDELLNIAKFVRRNTVSKSSDVPPNISHLLSKEKLEGPTFPSQESGEIRAQAPTPRCVMKHERILLEIQDEIRETQRAMARARATRNEAEAALMAAVLLELKRREEAQEYRLEGARDCGG